MTVSWAATKTFDPTAIGHDSIPEVDCYFGMTNDAFDADTITTASNATIRSPISVTCASRHCLEAAGKAGECRTDHPLLIKIGGQLSSTSGAQNFHYFPNAAPRLVTVTPATGDKAEYTPITLTGIDFADTSYAADTGGMRMRTALHCSADAGSVLGAVCCVLCAVWLHC